MINDAMILTESKTARDVEMRRADEGVLDKVKTLMLMPQLNMMTADQVAEYYEVPVMTVRNAFARHRDELIEDGVRKWSPKEIDTFLVDSFTKQECNGSGDAPETFGIPAVGIPNKVRGRKGFKLSDDVTLCVPNAGIMLYPKRAVLRMGMLLVDSPVAKAVRRMLLDIEQAAEQLPAEAYDALTDPTAMAAPTMTTAPAPALAIDDLQAHQLIEAAREKYEGTIAALKAQNLELTDRVEQLEADLMLAEQVAFENSPDGLDFADKYQQVVAQANELASGYNYYVGLKRIPDCISTLRRRSGQSNQEMWNEFYSALDAHGVRLKARARMRFYQKLRIDEMILARQAISELCSKYGVDPANVLWDLAEVH